jgi:mono/diheme cytochrome c family protein
MRISMVVGLVAVLSLAGYFYTTTRDQPVEVTATGATDAAAPRRALAQVVVPELSGNAAIGEKVFNAKCSACHGKNASGIDGAAPPLVHKIYEPSHHGDGAFLVAARNGVRSHHWKFGNMPPVEGITDAEIGLVVDYIRTMQRANGIN